MRTDRALSWRRRTGLAALLVLVAVSSAMCSRTRDNAEQVRADGKANISDSAPPRVAPPDASTGKYPDEWGVIFEKTKTPVIDPFPSKAHGAFNGFNPGARTVYKKGTIAHDGCEPLQSDIAKDSDVAVTMRDGAKIYADVFRPANATGKLPALVCWSPYGKATPRLPLAEIPVGKQGSSCLAKFECPDPGFFSTNGYAIVNVDPRGVNKSDGNVHYWGRVEAGDGYDLIEWIAGQEWSDGKVGMAGRSWPGLSQWYTGATQPPHLTALAPFHAHFTDYYRDHVALGGIPGWAMTKGVTDAFQGQNSSEATHSMIQKFPLSNPYWEDKKARVENITVPVYTVSGYTLGVEGARELFAKGHQQTWLRIQDGPNDDGDLLRFFDRYMKGIENGWETTPKVRVAVTDPGSLSQVNRPEASWPLPQTTYKQLFLDANTHTLSDQTPTAASTARYNAKDGDTTFTFTFQEDTELTGYPKLVLWVEAADADDMDVLVNVQKVDVQGKAHRATVGQLRASLRALDPERSTSYRPVHSLRTRELLSRGQIVPVEIQLLPLGMQWHKGEQLVVAVAGDKFGINSKERRDMSTVNQSINQGVHIIHTGSQYKSYLQVPVIPQPRRAATSN